MASILQAARIKEGNLGEVVVLLLLRDNIPVGAACWRNFKASERIRESENQKISHITGGMLHTCSGKGAQLTSMPCLSLFHFSP